MMNLKLFMVNAFVILFFFRGFNGKTPDCGFRDERLGTEKPREVTDSSQDKDDVNDEGKVDKGEILIRDRGDDMTTTTTAVTPKAVVEEMLVSINLLKQQPTMLGTNMHVGGILIHPKVVLTCCSCVTYALHESETMTPWRHNIGHYPVGIVHPEDLLFQKIKEHWVGFTKGKEIFIHPNCDNHYEVEVAFVVIQREIPGTHVAWLHTLDNMRIPHPAAMSTQELLGKCVIPVWYALPLTDRTIRHVVDEPVYFQGWDPCEIATCPKRKPSKLPPGAEQDPLRCNNTFPPARMCVKWFKPDRYLCGHYPGAPVFCEIGGIKGFMGFDLKHALSCEENNEQNGVVQMLHNVSLEWIKTAMRTPFRQLYSTRIPAWMTNLRRDYTVPTKPTESPQDVTFSSFGGHQLKTIVNVYYNTILICRGTLVTRLVVIVPCSCIAYSDHEPTNLKQDPLIYGVEKYVVNTISVILMIYDDPTRQRTRIEAAIVRTHDRCDSFFELDYGFIILSAEVPHSRVAWLMTANQKLMARLMRVLIVSDSALGNECFIYDRNLTAWELGTKPVFVKHKIQFTHWDSCITNVCSSWKIKDLIKDRCLGRSYGNLANEEIGIRFCVRSVDPQKDICNMPSGTPVFCDVESARGFVGFLSKAWTFCTNETMNDTAVFFSIHKYLPVFGTLTWIAKMEKLRDRLSASPNVLSTPLLLVICATVYTLVLEDCYW